MGIKIFCDIADLNLIRKLIKKSYKVLPPIQA